MAEATLRKLFEGQEVVISPQGARNAVFPITDFFPPLNPTDIEVLSTSAAAAVDDWTGITAIVGLGDRCSGPLVHGVALLRGLPYSLANWYPDGSVGDIAVENSGGFTGAGGVVYFNGLKEGDRVVYVDDVIRRGKRSTQLMMALTKAGVTVERAVFVADIEERNGLGMLKNRGIDAKSLCSVSVSDSRTRVKKIAPFVSSPSKMQYPRCDRVGDIKRRTRSEMMPLFRNVLNAFVGVKTYRAHNSTYPYCNFSLTDFSPLLTPQLVEDMADCMAWLGEFHTANLVVSESDRGGGPLVLAMARRTGLPFTMANWSQSPHSVGVAAAAQVGYSGSGQLFLNGVTRSSRCLVVDDMLSSGGTAEGLFRAIEAAGGKVAEAHFASEKVTTGGRTRLQQQWPKVAMYSVCFFDAGADTTVKAPPRYGSNETPIQGVAALDAKLGLFATILHRAVLGAIAYLYITKRGGVL